MKEALIVSSWRKIIEGLMGGMSLGGIIVGMNVWIGRKEELIGGMKRNEWLMGRMSSLRKRNWEPIRGKLKDEERQTDWLVEWRGMKGWWVEWRGVKGCWVEWRGWRADGWNEEEWRADGRNEEEWRADGWNVKFRKERKEDLIVGISSWRKRKGRAEIATEEKEERNSSSFSSRKEFCVTTTVSFHRAPTYLK
jgi:hypothetical protein